MCILKRVDLSWQLEEARRMASVEAVMLGNGSHVFCQ